MSDLSRQILLIVVAGMVLISFSLQSSNDGALYFLTIVLIWSIFAIGFDLVFGLTGLLSFGHAAFFGLGAYAFALLTLEGGAPFWLALMVAALCGAATAIVFGLFATRMQGVYLALTTLALAQLVNILVDVKLRIWTGGSDGLVGVPRPEAFGIDFYQDGNYAALVAGVFTLALAAAATIRRSPFGQVMSAIRQNETRVEQLGFEVRRYKIAVFGISGLFAGSAGGLMGALTSFVGPDMTHWRVSGDILIMTILGGRGTLLGPVLGVITFETLRDYISHWTDHWYGILGMVFIVFTLVLPEGLMGLARRTGLTWTKRPAA